MKQLAALIVIALISNPAWAQLFGEKKSPDEERAEIRKERIEIINTVAKDKPEIKKKIKDAAGYASFSAVNVNLLLLATARGVGIVKDNKTGKETFMKVTSLGGGIGAGVKDLQALLIFNEHETLKKFIESGWQFGAQADAALKSGDKGHAVGESASVAVDSEDGSVDTGLSSGAGDVTQVETAIEIYRITKSGISMQATIAGTKFSKDDDLN